MTEKTVQLTPWPDNPQGHFGGYSDTGPVRSGNEDTFWIPSDTTPTQLGELFIVADGVGGQHHGRAAADRAALTVHSVFYRLRQEQDAIRDAIKEAILQANTAVMAEAEQLGGGKMGSTIVTCSIDQGVLTVAHVGDARAYLLRAGQMRQLTRDDSWVQRQVDAGLLTPEEAANHELRNVVTQVLGNKPDITVHLSKSIPLQDGDLMLLCSDGLYDVLSDLQMSGVMINNAPQAAAEMLVQMAAAGGATDNITAVVVRYGPPEAIMPLAAPVSMEKTMADTQSAPAFTPPLAAPPTRKRSSKLPLIIAAVLVVVLLIILGIWIWSSSNTGTSSKGDEPVATLPVVATAVPDINQPPLATETVSALKTVASPAPLPSNTPDLNPTAINQPTVTVETFAASDEIKIGSTVRISGTVVNIRSESNTENDENILFEVFQNTAMQVIDGPEEGSGYQWWKVKLNDDREGWVAAELIEQADTP